MNGGVDRPSTSTAVPQGPTAGPQRGGSTDKERSTTRHGVRLKLLLSIFILTTGVACAWFYLRRPPMPDNSPWGANWTHRPWRRVGAAICLVVAVMFVLGVYLVDEPQHPRTYAAFWLVMMVLVVWLCGLALKDVLYTRQLIERWRLDRKKARLAHGSEQTGSEESRP